jgi:hypothetical protein
MRELVNLVNDIELVLFEGKDYSNLPSVDEVKTLRKIAEETRVSYSLQFSKASHWPCETIESRLSKGNIHGI